MHDLARKYGVTKSPLIALAPMRLIATAPLTAAVSNSGGLGFLAAGTDVSILPKMLTELDGLLEKPSASNGAHTVSVGRFGVGVICWGVDIQAFVKAIEEAPRFPCAVWLFAPRTRSELKKWSEAIRSASKGCTDIWVQVGSVAEAKEVCISLQPEVLICQGSDAGGHGLSRGCSFASLIPEVSDALDVLVASGNLKQRPHIVAAGGIADGRGAAAAIAVGAEGISMGTRFLASPEAAIADGYKQEVVRAGDGGQNTIRSKVYDMLRGTTDWPENYGGRGIINASYDDWQNGLDNDKNKELYAKSMKEDGDNGWGPQGRMTTYAGTAIGIVKEIKGAGAIVQEVADGCRQRLDQLKAL